MLELAGTSAAGPLERTDMKVLMTGHKGYIGSVMAPIFSDAGHTVVGLDSNLFEGCTFGECPPEIGAKSR